MAEARSEDQQYRFLIPVSRTWKLLIPLIVAVVYFAFVLTIVLAQVDLGIADQELVLVLGGLGLFGLLAVWELMLIPRVRVKRKKRKAAAAQAEPQVLESEPDTAIDDDAQYQAPAAPAPAVQDDVEYFATGDERNGRRVLELSMPPKSLHRGAIYSKAFIPVDDRFVLRVEDIVASPEELG